MKEYEGAIKIKWHKNDHADTRSLFILAKNGKDLNAKLNKIKSDFKNGDDPNFTKVQARNIGRRPFKITFNMSERK